MTRLFPLVLSEAVTRSRGMVLLGFLTHSHLSVRLLSLVKQVQV